ncbi:MAG: 2Fe-2S iron-sulfur cluster-binding protein [Pigmentiphaga sp.]
MVAIELISLRLKSITWQNELIRSYELVSADGSALPSFTAGAHIGLILPVGTRSYSLLNDPSETHRYVLGVAREPDGRGGSAFMHDQLQVGATLKAIPPSNLFPLHDGNALALLIAGGIGITPMLSMAAHLESMGRQWRLVYAVRSAEQEAFRDQLQQWPHKVTRHRDNEAGSVLDLASLVTSAPVGTHFYCCGPGPMLAAYQQACASLPSDEVHLERFSADVDESAGTIGFDVILAKSGRRLHVGESKTILQAFDEVGISAPRSCEQGVCGMCETPVLDGIPDHRDSLLSEHERRTNKVMMICCSRSLTPSLTLDI